MLERVLLKTVEGLILWLVVEVCCVVEAMWMGCSGWLYLGTPSA